MRKRRILSLLLAVAVTATMLIAVPLTASANYSDTDNLITWDFGEYTTENLQPESDGSVETVPTLQYHELTIYGNTKGPGKNDDGSDKAIGDYVTSKGFHTNGKSSDTTRYITYKPVNNGKITVIFKSNSNGEQNFNKRWLIIGKTAINTTACSDFPTVSSDVLAAEYAKLNSSTYKAEDTEISANLVAGTQYYIYFGGGGQTISKITYAYTSSGTEPGGGGGGGTDTEAVTAEGYSKSFASTNKNFVDWTYHEEASSKPVYTDLNDPKYRTSNGLDTNSLPKIAFYNKDSGEVSTPTAIDVSGDTTVSKDTFDLPHKTHKAHSGEKRYVLKTQSIRSLTITGALPNETFNSYDLIIVYNNNSGSSSTTFTISQDGTEDSLKTYEDKGDNLKTTDPDEVIFRNVNVNDVKLTWTQEIDIYSVSLDYHKQARADVTLKRSEKADYVSGIYYENDDDTEGEARGVIRFFQDYSGEADGYGFVFIDGNGDFVEGSTTIKNGRIVKSNADENTLSEKSGFYGDVYNILKTNFEPGVIAVPYVSVDGYIIFAEKPITGKVNEGNVVKHEEEWEWTVTE